jgi:hypothetical protein
MKYLITHPLESAITMFWIIVAVVIFWAAFRPEIKDVIRNIQKILFWWQ